MTEGKSIAQGVQGKTLVHLQAERMAQSMYAGFLAGAGVGYNQIAKEVLYFLPRDFLDIYEEVWHAGVAGKDDGGTGARGAAQAETGRVGKAATRNVPGGMQISSGGAKRKGYKKYWVIADEEALELKDRLDKRLRGLAREARAELADIRARRQQVAGEGTGESGLVAGRTRGVDRGRCSECGRLIGAGWKFCPNDGQATSGGEG
jgi:hypothetical protein